MEIQRQTALRLWRIATTLMAISAMAFLYGCGGGGGGGGGGSDSPPNTTVYDITKYTSLNTGDTLSISLTGTDTSGGRYTGFIQAVVDGPTVFEGKDVIKKTLTTIIDKTNYGTILSGTITFYYNQDRTLYKGVVSNGVTITPSNVFEMPTTIKVGDAYDGQDLSYSNGNTLMSNWEVVDAGNGNAIVIITDVSNTITATRDTLSLVISPDGNILSTREVINNFPSHGATATFTGTVN